MKKINGKKISLCSNAQDRMRRFACLQDCLLTLTCHLARNCNDETKKPSNLEHTKFAQRYRTCTQTSCISHKRTQHLKNMKDVFQKYLIR